jgi:hypothetical protein
VGDQRAGVKERRRRRRRDARHCHPRRAGVFYIPRYLPTDITTIKSTWATSLPSSHASCQIHMDGFLPFHPFPAGCSAGWLRKCTAWHPRATHVQTSPLPEDALALLVGIYAFPHHHQLVCMMMHGFCSIRPNFSLAYSDGGQVHVGAVLCVLFELYPSYITTRASGSNLLVQRSHLPEHVGPPSFERGTRYGWNWVSVA